MIYAGTHPPESSSAGTLSNRTPQEKLVSYREGINSFSERTKDFRTGLDWMRGDTVSCLDDWMDPDPVLKNSEIPISWLRDPDPPRNIPGSVLFFLFFLPTPRQSCGGRVRYGINLVFLVVVFVLLLVLGYCPVIFWGPVMHAGGFVTYYFLLDGSRY